VVNVNAQSNTIKYLSFIGRILEYHYFNQLLFLNTEYSHMAHKEVFCEYFYNKLFRKLE